MTVEIVLAFTIWGWRGGGRWKMKLEWQMIFEIERKQLWRFCVVRKWVNWNRLEWEKVEKSFGLISFENWGHNYCSSDHMLNVECLIPHLIPQVFSICSLYPSELNSKISNARYSQFPPTHSHLFGFSFIYSDGNNTQLDDSGGVSEWISHNTEFAVIARTEEC